MRVAALYDIHGNLPALEAVLREVSQAKVDRVIVGGDVFPGPLPRESLLRLLELDMPVSFLLGNGDREVLARMNGIETAWFRSAPEQWREPVRWTARQLQPEHQRQIASWPATLPETIPGLGDVLFCHATPHNDTDCFTRLTPASSLAPIFDGIQTSMVICGHTHMPFDRRIGKLRVINAGSVGMPFGEPGASWLLLGPEVQFRKTCYDFAEAANRVRATSYPQAEAFAAESILQPPPEEVILQAFAKAESHWRAATD